MTSASKKSTEENSEEVECTNGSRKRRMRQRERNIYISECHGIKELSSLVRRGFQQIMTARGLFISGCPDLVKLDDGTSGEEEGGEYYRQLEEVQVSRCPRLTDLSGLGKCKYLKVVDISDCRKLENIGELKSCRTLEKLALSRCTGLVDVNLRGFGKLLSFYIFKCANLTKICGLLGCPILETLTVEECGDVKEMEVRTIRGRVETLRIAGKRAMENVGFLCLFTNMKKLALCGCVGTVAEVLGEEAGGLPRLKWLELIGIRMERQMKDKPGNGVAATEGGNNAKRVLPMIVQNE
ncbi:hypothetical protein, conserved [Trypanosoma brucei gambiense DAL972]|uniref:Leucine-rich repeat protein (LRRP) n=2 Tax=Trypanosoma brucei TaxID=5691 RepID=C9ZK21_TRYB9|nr:hypothetical protein, conserved [Trypanosoma brucei gambiense DAL972]RHW73428.1 hypothetical protein DPX39_030016300 [Trypanosoma brucei equiperdum]CBH09785.1 hypothetical protein, conserved [Trypanosoma brucei gambiense DAL972]|eukprot:XP_011772078.1 hypothetical protein, conserved [Trypanosoma brucei gambiense DAL972]